MAVFFHCQQSIPSGCQCFFTLFVTRAQQGQCNLNQTFGDLNKPAVEMMPRGHFIIEKYEAISTVWMLSVPALTHSGAPLQGFKGYGVIEGQQ